MKIINTALISSSYKNHTFPKKKKKFLKKLSDTAVFSYDVSVTVQSLFSFSDGDEFLKFPLKRG